VAVPPRDRFLGSVRNSAVTTATMNPTHRVSSP
jgi:hypothetical protein